MNSLISHYEFGKVTVADIEYTSDILILNKEVIPNWWRKEGHSLYLEDIHIILDYKPELLIIGTGYYGYMKIPDNFAEKLPFPLKQYKTQKAIDIYMQNLKLGIKIAAGFHLTC